MRSLILLLLTLLTACQSPALSLGPTPTPTPEPTPTPVPCHVQAAPFVADARELAGRLSDLYDVAGSTPRMGLAPLVQQFQDLRREAEELAAPECAENTKLLLVESIRDGTDGFIAFMAQKQEHTVSHLFESAAEKMTTVAEQLDELESPPEPTPTPAP